MDSPLGVKRMKKEAEGSLTVNKVVSLKNIISFISILTTKQIILWKHFLILYGKIGSK